MSRYLLQVVRYVIIIAKDIYLNTLNKTYYSTYFFCLYNKTLLYIICFMLSSFSSSLVIHAAISQRKHPLLVSWMSLETNKTRIENIMCSSSFEAPDEIILLYIFNNQHNNSMNKIAFANNNSCMQTRNSEATSNILFYCIFYISYLFVTLKVTVQLFKTPKSQWLS